MSNEQERIDKLDEQLKQLKNKKRALLTKQRAKEKKENAKRLIDLGAIAEEVLGCEGATPDQFRKLLTDLKKNGIRKQQTGQVNNKQRNPENKNQTPPINNHKSQKQGESKPQGDHK